MDSIAYAWTSMTAAPAQALTSEPMQVQHARLLPAVGINAAARTKGQVSVTPIEIFPTVWSPPPRREPL